MIRRDDERPRRPAFPFTPKPEREVDDELAFHLEQRVRDYVTRGMSPDAARAAALERLGDLRGVRTECAAMLAAERRSEARRDWLGDLRQDIRFAVRSARRAPLFTLLAVITLALGIGANAAVFGVVKSVLLDALPYRDADRLVRVYAHLEGGSLERSSLSAGAITDIEARQHSFSSLAPFYHATLDITYSGEAGPNLLNGALVGAGMFRTLGVSAALGRTHTDADAASGAAKVVVLGYGAWQRYLGGDAHVVGKKLQLLGDAYEVVGVLPPGFVGPVQGGEVDLWFALDLEPALRDPVRARQQHWLALVGRLKPGATVDAAQRELAAIATSLQREYPASDAGHSFVAVPMRAAMVGDTRTPLIVLMASAGLVLLITCGNLAGTLLSRTIGRRREFAVRIALGAGRGRLVRQLLTESTLLAMIGGAVGIGLAQAGLTMARTLAATALPPYANLSLDRGALLVTVALALLTGLAFGLAPALSVGRTRFQRTLREETRAGSESVRSRRLRGVLVAGQLALSITILAGAGLLAHSLWVMATAPLGFEPHGVVTTDVKLQTRRYGTSAAQSQFFEQFEARLRALPGVTDVASVSELPAPSLARNGLAIQGVTWPKGSAQPFMAYESVSDDYFRVMRLPLRQGRTFTAADRDSASPVFVISEGMARRFWPDGKALGARIKLGPERGGPWGEVIGIVGDVRNDPAAPVPEPMAYASQRQDPWSSRTMIIRTQGDPLSLVRPIRRELAAIDPSLPFRGAMTLSAFLGGQLTARRLPVMLLSAFGVLALLLASVGVYALFANMAAAREREFGVRVALGSSPRAIAGLVVRQGAVWMIVGLAAGTAGVVLVGQLLRDMLYGVPALDPFALGGAVLVMIAAATVALLVPVRRATRVDPITVLR